MLWINSSGGYSSGSNGESVSHSGNTFSTSDGMYYRQGNMLVGPNGSMDVSGMSDDAISSMLIASKGSNNFF